MRVFIGVLLMISSLAQAGHIELVNGDRFAGDLIRVDGDNLIWKSETFGERALPKNRIKNINSSTPFKINGNKYPCIIEGMEQEELVYYCGLRSRMNRMSLLSIKALAPYEDFIQEKYLFAGKLGLQGAYIRGNETRDEWTMSGDASFRRSEWRHVLSGDYSRVSYSGGAAPIKWNSRYSLDWFFRERLFWYNNIALGAEELRALDSYYSLGFGAGYQFWESRQSALAVKIGATYFEENYIAPSVIPSDYKSSDTFAAALMTLDYRYTLPLGIEFFSNNEFHQSVDDGKNWRLKSVSGLGAKVIGSIYSEVKLDYYADQNPRPGKKPSDTRLSVGMSYKW